MSVKPSPSRSRATASPTRTLATSTGGASVAASTDSTTDSRTPLVCHTTQST